MEQLKIFDTTLRDGEQSPGASMSVDQKLKFALQAEKLNIDILEAGFPVSSPVQFEACRLIASELTSPVIAGLARTKKEDIDAVYNSLKKAKNPRIHTFIATSDIHLKYKLQKTKSQVLKMAIEGVRYACSLCRDVEFSAEDATRTDLPYLAEVTEAVIDAGCRTINLPDTVGYTVPQEYFDLIAYIKKNVRNINNAVISVHCHNDLGLGVANSLSAVLAGARQIECSVNGRGERAGNASLEEIVMGIKTRSNFFRVKTAVNTREIFRTSRMLVHLTGIQLQAHKPVVGKNAFAHEAGIHQHGMVKNRKTYEIMTPASIGLGESSIVLGRHSGQHGFRKKLEELEIRVPKEKFDRLFASFMELADKKKQIFDEDILILAGETINFEKDYFILDYVAVSTGTNTIPTATVRIKKLDAVYSEAACGDGPVDAVYRAIDKITGNILPLLDYEIKAATSGKDAIGEVRVSLKNNNSEINGSGYSTDIIEASARAYLNAINKYFRIKKNRK